MPEYREDAVKRIIKVNLDARNLGVNVNSLFT